MWKRVIAPTILISLLWIGASSVTTHFIGQLTTSYSRVMSENVATIQAADAMQDVLWKLQGAAAQAHRDQDREGQIELAGMFSKFDSHLAEARQSATMPEEKALVDSLEKDFEPYRAYLLRRAETRDVPEANGNSEGERSMRLAQPVFDSCRKLAEVNEKLLKDTVDENTRFASLMNLVRLTFLIAGPAVGVLFGLRVARGLRRSISQISITLRDAAGGLEEVGRVTVAPSGDLPGLQEQVQAVSARIREVMEELQAARREAMRAERLAAVGQLAAGVAHELRNPLTSVKLLIQAAAQRFPARPLSEKQLQVLQQEITRMENTIQGLLDFARPPALHRVRHDLRETLKRALNLVGGRAKQQGVTVRAELPESPLVLDADPEQLHQVFVNLALNGIESMEGGGALRVSLETDGLPGACRVVFADCGAGIPQQVLDHIFEPFVTSKEHGTGLGLAVSRRIVREHGGTLVAANRTEGGAVFTVELPCDGSLPDGLTADRAANADVVPNASATPLP